MAKSYEVGYGKPPAATRFQKGKSGNRKGRPKAKAPDFQDTIRKLLGEKVQVTENGNLANLTKLELISKRLVNEAASGNLKAFDKLLKLEALFDKLPENREEKRQEAAVINTMDWVKDIVKNGPQSHPKNEHLPQN